MINKEKPNILHLQIFGSTVYVYLPENICQNSLVPKFELMVFLGVKEETKEYLFMRIENIVEFTATMTLFDKELFSRYPDLKQQNYTCMNKNHTKEYSIKKTDENLSLDIEDLPFLPKEFPTKDKQLHYSSSRGTNKVPGDNINPLTLCLSTL